MKPFRFTFSNFKDGLAPGYWKNDYPKYGNLSHAGKAKSIDIFDQGYLGPGFGTSVLTNGTETGIHSRLIKTVDLVTGKYAGGIKYIHKINNYGLVSDSNFPHEIPDVQGNVAEVLDIVTYQGNVFYTIKQALGGDRIGKYIISPEIPYSLTGFHDDYINTFAINGEKLYHGGSYILKVIPDGNILTITNGPFISTYIGYFDEPKTVQSTLHGGIGSSDTSLNVSPGTGVRFPLKDFYLVIDDPGKQEIVYCTSRSSDTLTVQRGRLGTTAVSHNSGVLIYGIIGWANVFDSKAVFLEKNFVGRTSVYASNLLWVGGSIESGDLNGRIFSWDGVSNQYNNVISVDGIVGSLFAINNVVYVIYKVSKYNGKDVCRIGYITGDRIQDVLVFSGTLPTHHKVTNFNGGVSIEIDGDIYFFGQHEPGSNAVFFPFTSSDYINVGCIKKTPIGFFITSENVSGTKRSISHIPEIAGLTPIYKTDGYWKSVLISSDIEKEFYINELIVRTSKLTSGQKATIVVNCDNGNIITKTISYSEDGAITKKVFPIKKIAENMRIEVYWEDGSTTSPLYIKSITVKGHYQTTI